MYGLAIPHLADLTLWLRAFLQFLYTRDPAAVPTPPPLMSTPEDWYTPTEATIVARIADIDNQRAQLDAARVAAEEELVRLTEVTNAGDRAVLWLDGDDLAAAVTRASKTVSASRSHLPTNSWNEGSPRTRTSGCRHPTTREPSCWWRSRATRRAPRRATSARSTRTSRTTSPPSTKSRMRRGGSSTTTESPIPAPDSRRCKMPRTSRQDSTCSPSQPRALRRLWQDVAFARCTTLEARQALLAVQPGLWMGPRLVNSAHHMLMEGRSSHRPNKRLGPESQPSQTPAQTNYQKEEALRDP